jgi:hypothetical protein
VLRSCANQYLIFICTLKVSEEIYLKPSGSLFSAEKIIVAGYMCCFGGGCTVVGRSRIP